MIAPWLVHLYTASGAVCALMAMSRVFNDDYTGAFAWLAVALVIDASDGVLARGAQVAIKTPHFNGAKLDDIVDYLTYVFVPAFFVWHAGLVPIRWSIPIAAAILLSSAYGFNRDDAKTDDHFFTGFPSYWNLVVFYLWVAGLPPVVNASVLAALAVSVFVPIRYLYPSRTPVARRSTVALGVVWGLLMLVMLWQAPDVPPVVFWLSLLFPAYYVALSLALEFRRRKATQ
jgi:phosphatidylcholine synthase